MTSHAIEPMRRPWAEAVSVWLYGGAYEMYSMDGSEACVQELLDGGYYAWLNKEGRPEGYFCFGPPAQIPTREEGVYPAGPLDIGLGMAPELCGTGQGGAFLEDGLKFARERFGARDLRLTVASFNKRAIRVYQRAGFAAVREAAHKRSGMAFTVMARPAEA